MILLAPLLIFGLIALSVRSRRAAGNLAILAPILSLAGVLLAGWAELKKTPPYDGIYEWLNVSTAFTGPAQFQSYIIDVGVRVSHLTTLLMLCALAISLSVVVWSRAGARGEPSPGRYHALLTLLLTAALGVLVSTDLSELYVFWGVGAVATYLLLSNAWSDDAATRAARLSLAVPVLTDVALLAGVALLYSRYGQLNLDGLIPVLQSTAGAGPKALTVAAILLFAGAAGRLGLFPFHGWLTGSSATPTGALAATQGFWTLMAAGLLFKAAPIFVSAGLLPLRIVAVTAAVSAVGVPLLGLAGLDVRRAVTAAGIGVSALAVLAFARPGVVAPAALLLAATALARTGATLATGSLVAGMRTSLISEMGEGWRRMRLSMLALPLAGVGLVGGVGQVAGGSMRWWWALAYGLGLGLAMLGVFRVYFLAGHALLPRRRGFDPNRVRPAPPAMAYPPLFLGLLAVVLSVGFFSGRWLGYADNLVHHRTSTVVAVEWIAAALAGILLATLLFVAARPLGNRLGAGAASLWDRGYGIGRSSLQGVVVAAPLKLTELAEDDGLAAGESRLARLVAAAGHSFHRPLPLLPVLIGLAVVVVVVAALTAPGVNW
jgi:NADH-quinone oxidoreductase subunit L